VTFGQFQSGEGKLVTIRNFSVLKFRYKKMFNERLILTGLKANVCWKILMKPIKTLILWEVLEDKSQKPVHILP
jgi:hypothetical protein